MGYIWWSWCADLLLMLLCRRSSGRYFVQWRWSIYQYLHKWKLHHKISPHHLHALNTDICFVQWRYLFYTDVCQLEPPALLVPLPLLGYPFFLFGIPWIGRRIVFTVIKDVSVIIAVSIADIIMPIHGVIESVVTSLDGLNIGAVINGLGSVGSQWINTTMDIICYNIYSVGGIIRCLNLGGTINKLSFFGSQCINSKINTICNKIIFGRGIIGCFNTRTDINNFGFVGSQCIGSYIRASINDFCLVGSQCIGSYINVIWYNIHLVGWIIGCFDIRVVINGISFVGSQPTNIDIPGIQNEEFIFAAVVIIGRRYLFF